MELDDRARDVALVERVAGGLQAGHPGIRTAPRRCRAFLVGHVLHGAREVGLAPDLARLGRTAVREEHRVAGRVALVRRLVLLQELGHQFVHREAVARETDRRRSHFAEAHRAVQFERSQPGIGRGRHDRADRGGRDLPAVVLHEVVGRDPARPDAQPVDRDQLAGVGLEDDDRGNAAEAHLLGLGDAERDARSHAGVDRVAARLEDLERRMRGEVVSGGHHVAGTHDRGAHRRHGGSPAGIGLCAESTPSGLVPPATG